MRRPWTSMKGGIFLSFQQGTRGEMKECLHLDKPADTSTYTASSTLNRKKVRNSQMRHDENSIKSVGLEEYSLPYNVVFSIYDVMRWHYFCWSRYSFILLFIYCILVVRMLIVMSYVCAIMYVTIYLKMSFLMRIKTTGKLKTQSGVTDILQRRL